MRGDGFAPAIISTYAVGTHPRGPSPARAGTARRNFAFPAVLLLGTASALAVVFASAGQETGVKPSPVADREGPASADDATDWRGEIAAEPGFSLGIERPPPPPSGGRPSTQLTEPPVQARASLSVREASPLPRRSSAPTRTRENRLPLSAPLDACLPSCAGNAARADTGAQSDVLDGSEPAVPLAARQAVTSFAEGDSSAKAQTDDLGADAAPEGDLLVDALHSTMVEPGGELVAAETEASTPVAPPTELTIQEASAASLQSDDSAKVGSGEPTAPPLAATTEGSGAVEGVEDNQGSAPSAEISRRLRRIGERYASTGAAEAGAFANTTGGEPVAAALPSNASAQSESVAGSVAVAADMQTGGVVIQDDALVAIELGTLVSLFEERLERPLFVWLRSSGAASKFATPETLAAAGIRTAYDPQRKQLVFSVEDD